MPDEVKTTQESEAVSWTKAWNGGFPPIYAVNHRAFECWARGMAKLSHDMAQFMQSRLLEESTMWEKLATCHDFTDAFDCHSRFVVKAGLDYSETAQRLSRLAYEIANNYGAALRSAPKVDA